MLTECCSYDGKCPCLECDDNCCIENNNECDFMTDTEKLCEKAREHCEKCAKENKQ